LKQRFKENGVAKRSFATRIAQKSQATRSQAPAWEHTFPQKLSFYDNNQKMSGNEYPKVSLIKNGRV